MWKKLVLAISMLCLMVISTTFISVGSDTAYATLCPTTRGSERSCNDTEASQGSARCKADGNTGPWGVMWVSSKMNSKVDPQENIAGGYYNDVVYATAESGTVDVELHGSMDGCSPRRILYAAKNAGKTIYAIDVVSFDSRLTLKSKVFNRGTMPSNPTINNVWTSRGSAIMATLDVSKIPADGNRHDITVSVHRCASDDGKTIAPWATEDSECATHDQVIRIFRSKPVQWSTSGYSGIKKSNTANDKSDGGFVQSNITVKPGEYINFKHYITKSGPGKPTSIQFKLQQTGMSTKFPGKGEDLYLHTQTNFSSNTFAKFGNMSGYDSSYSWTQVTASDIGKTFCERLWWKPNSNSSSGPKASGYVCAKVVSNFSLVPTVGSSNGSTSIGTITQGGSVQVDSSILNTGLARSDNNKSDADVYTFAIKGVAARITDSQLISALNAVFNKQTSGWHYLEVTYPSRSTTCTILQSISALNGKISDCNVPNYAGSDAFDATKVVDSSQLSAAGYNVGDLICRVATVSRYNNDTTGNAQARRVAYPACYRVAKSPMVQVWGGDVRVGSSDPSGIANSSMQYKSVIDTGGSRNVIIQGTNHVIGSWGEYGLMAPKTNLLGSNINSASGGSLSGIGAGSPLTTSASQKGTLSFANTSNVYGQWGVIGAQSVAQLNDFSGSSTQISSSSVSLDELNGKYTVKSSVSTLNIGGDVASGKKIIIDARGKNVVITGNISYADGNYSSVSSIPQVIIYAKNILIKDSVTNVDAWLLAMSTKVGNSVSGGIISTCDTDPNALTRSDYTSELNASVCNQPLRINGPVSARELQLRRTAGADGTDTNINGYTAAAETINLRADAYLWAYGNAALSGLINTDATTELSPRY